MSAAIIPFPSHGRAVPPDVICVVPAAEDAGPFMLLRGRGGAEHTIASGLNLGPAVYAAIMFSRQTGVPFAPDFRDVVLDIAGPYWTDAIRALDDFVSGGAAA